MTAVISGNLKYGLDVLCYAENEIGLALLSNWSRLSKNGNRLLYFFAVRSLHFIHCRII